MENGACRIWLNVIGAVIFNTYQIEFPVAEILIRMPVDQFRS